MHAREICTRRRPTTAGGAPPPLRRMYPHKVGYLGYPLAMGATPLTGGHPHPGGFADLADRISKASCYRIPLTFFFGNSAAALSGCSHQKAYRKLSEKTAGKLPPPRQYFRLDIYRSLRNNLQQFHATKQKGSSHAQSAV